MEIVKSVFKKYFSKKKELKKILEIRQALINWYVDMFRLFKRIHLDFGNIETT